MDCIFCKIVSGSIPSYKIYEDDYLYAFLDINPLENGHTLIIPKIHTLDISTIETDILIKIFNTSKNISQILIDKLGASGFTLLQNNGIAQDVKHFHLHVIPKYKKKKKMSIEEVYEILTK